MPSLIPHGTLFVDPHEAALNIVTMQSGILPQTIGFKSSDDSEDLMALW